MTRSATNLRRLQPMLSSLLLVKLAVTMVAVVGLSLVAERLSTRLAGVLAGFPHGIAIVLYFIGVEQGADFAAQAAGFATAGLAANVGLAFAYARLSARFGTASLAVPGAALGAVAAFLLIAAVLRLIAPGPWLAVVLTLAMIGAVRWLLRGSGARGQVKRPKARAAELLARAGLAGAIVALITGIAAWVGPDWAGLFAGFPVVTFPLLVILHARHGAAPVASVVRHYPFGILSLLVFTLVVRWAFAATGMGWGTLIGLTASLLYLSLASVVQARLR